jgi:hypothetical protein
MPVPDLTYTQLYANNATTTLLNQFAEGDTELTVVNGTGDLFPAITLPEEYYLVTLENVITKEFEIVQVYGRADDVMTGIIRGAELTTERTFPAGSKVELRVTKDTLNRLKDLATAASANYTHDQAVGSLVWNIVHNLNKFPHVTLLDQNGNIMVAHLEYVSANEINAYFSASMAGTAYVG